MRTKVSGRRLAALFLLLLTAIGTGAVAAPLQVRLKDVAYVQGVRDNQLVGFGLVAGLQGRGDTSSSSMLQKVVQNLAAAFGVMVAEKDIKSRNCAVVMVTATLPSFSHSGDRIPVTVSSIGDATDLTGGVLLQTNLKAANDQVYAVAQGLVASTGTSSVKTVGDIPYGAIVEKATSPIFTTNGTVQIILRNPDFITANAAVGAISKAFPKVDVHAVDPSRIEVKIPSNETGNPVGFIANLEQLTLTPDASNAVVINPRTGVVVVGQNVRIGSVAVSYKDAQISIGELSNPYYGLKTGSENPFVISNTTTVQDLVSVLKEAGVGADTVIEVLKAIDRAGALYGKLIVM